MGIELLLYAREKEYNKELHAKKGLVKKREIIGSIILFFIGFGFLLKIFTILLYTFFLYFPKPQIIIFYLEERIPPELSLDMVHTLSLYEQSFFFLVCFISFLSFLLIAFGLYLMLFNKFILCLNLKFLTFIAVGVFFWILVGFKVFLELLV